MEWDDTYSDGNSSPIATKREWVKEVIGRCEYPNYGFAVSDTTQHIEVNYTVPDVDNPGKTCELYTGFHWTMDHTEKGLIEELLLVVAWTKFHEVREFFKYRGVLVSDPHNHAYEDQIIWKGLRAVKVPIDLSELAAQRHAQRFMGLEAGQEELKNVATQ